MTVPHRPRLKGGRTPTPAREMAARAPHRPLRPAVPHRPRLKGRRTSTLAREMAAPAPHRPLRPALRPSMRAGPKGIRGRIASNKEKKAVWEAARAADAERAERISAGIDAADDAADEDTAASAPPDAKSNVVRSCVKMKLASFCPDAGVRALLKSIVASCNTAVAEAYAFANLHVTRTLEAGGAAPSVDCKFYDRCLIAVTANNARKDALDAAMMETRDAFDGLRPEGAKKADFRLLGDIKSELIIGMAAMAANHLLTNLEARVAKYLAWKVPGMHKSLRGAIVVAVAVQPRTPLAGIHAFAFENAVGDPVSDSRRAETRRAMTLASDMRGICPIAGTGAASRAHELLPLMHMIMQETEAAHAAHQQGLLDARVARKLRKARFTLLPNKNGFTAGHVPICSRALIGILRRVKRRDGAPLSVATRNAQDPMFDDAAWRAHFNVNAVETYERYFGNRISTDGYAVTVFMERTQACVLPTKSGQLDRGRIELALKAHDVLYCGVDPGLTDVVTVAHTGDASAPKDGVKAVPSSTSSYSSSRYYEEAKFKASKLRTDKWNLETAAEVGGIDHATDRSTSAGLARFIGSYLAVLRPLLTHRPEAGYRNMRFMRHRFKQKAVTAICDLIAPSGKFTVVGYGDWAGPKGSPIKRRFAGPQQDIKRELKARHATVLFHDIWEYKTSVTCHETWRRLTNMRAESVSFCRREHRMLDRPRGSVHKVLHCRSSAGAPKRQGGRTWNRDINAAKNMLMLLLREVRGAARPSEFTPARLAARRRGRGTSVGADLPTTTLSVAPPHASRSVM